MAVDRALRQRELQRENRNLRQQLQETLGLENIIGRSPAMVRIFELIKKAARSEANILVLGESGTGKELVARAIHANSERASQPFVPVDCASLPEQLLESELFGHEKGAFTGAVKTKSGLIEMAHRGTLFLDEIGELPLALQSKFLRSLQERTIRRVGGTGLIERGHAGGVGHQPQPARGDRPGPLSRGAVLPDQRDRHRAACAARPRAATCRSWPRPSSRSTAAASPSPSTRRRWPRWRAMPGPATCASCRTSSSARAPWPTAPRSGAATCPTTCCAPRRPRGHRPALTANGLPAVRTDLPLKRAKDQWMEALEGSYLRALLEHHQGNISAAAKAAEIDRKTFHRLINKYRLR